MSRDYDVRYPLNTYRTHTESKTGNTSISIEIFKSYKQAHAFALVCTLHLSFIRKYYLYL